MASSLHAFYAATTPSTFFPLLRRLCAFRTIRVREDALTISRVVYRRGGLREINDCRLDHGGQRRLVERIVLPQVGGAVLFAGRVAVQKACRVGQMNALEEVDLDVFLERAPAADEFPAVGPDARVILPLLRQFRRGSPNDAPNLRDTRGAPITHFRDLTLDLLRSIHFRLCTPRR